MVALQYLIILAFVNIYKMTYPEELQKKREKTPLNNNKVIHDYKFYLKMYAAHQKMDFDGQTSD